MSLRHTTDQTSIARARLLVVEDDPNVHDFLVRLFRMNGYEVTSVENGRVALERLHESHYDLVLTDEKMPEMGGIELVRELRQHHPSVASIVMTSHPTLEATREVFKLGADDYLTKPITIDDLEGAVHRALGNKGLPKSVALWSIEFHSCFISYSHKDEEFARRLHGRMQQEHLRVWFAPEDMKGGQKLHEQIDQAIRVHDKLVLVLSEQSIQSEWVMTEIRKARKAELSDKRRKLFPLRLVDMDTLRHWECFDADTGKDLAIEVREYFIPDFTNWKDHDAFERAFARFLKDLQAVEAPPVPRAVEAPKLDEAPKSSSNTRPQNPQTIIARKKRRLEVLEEQQAIKGISTPPEVVTEIEDLRREIEHLDTE